MNADIRFAGQRYTFVRLSVYWAVIRLKWHNTEYIGYLIIPLQYIHALYCPRVRGDPPLISGIIVSLVQPSNVCVCVCVSWWANHQGRIQDHTSNASTVYCKYSKTPELEVGMESLPWRGRSIVKNDTEKKLR